MCIKQENRLRNVFFRTEPEWDAEKKQLAEMLEQEEICCRDLEYFAGTDQLDWERMQNGLLITDHRETADTAAQNGIVCIGLDRNMSSFFTGAVLVCDSLDSLDRQTLEEAFLRAKGLPVQIAETERLIIREIAVQDIDGLCRISRMDGMEYLMPIGKTAADFFDRENLSAYISTVYRFYGYGLWSVLKKDGTLIGCCGFQDYEANCLELQYMLAPDCWRQGFGSEMCDAAIRYALARTEAEELCVRIHSENHAAQALARKLGFTGEGDILKRKICGSFR